MTHVFRFFLPDEEPAAPGQVRALSTADARRVERVLRLRAGEPVEVADAGGRVFAGNVVPQGRVRIGELLEEPAPIPLLALRIALTGPRADTAVEKLVELGVEDIGPLETQLKKRDTRTDRWQRIATAAAGQSKRPRVPTITGGVALDDALVPGAIMLSHEHGPDGGLDAALARHPEAPVVLLVGPESGFTEDEHARARGAACRSRRSARSSCARRPRRSRPR